MKITPAANLVPSPLPAPSVGAAPSPIDAHSVSADAVVLGTSAPQPDAESSPQAASAPAAQAVRVPATQPAPQAAPTFLEDIAAPAVDAAPRAMVLRGAALWSSLDAAGWLRDGFSDPPPERPLTPPEKAGLIAEFDSVREKGFVFYRDHGTDSTVDLRPVDDADLGGLIDGATKIARWKMSYEHGATPARYGFIHFLHRVPELAYFSGATDSPHGLAAPATAAAIRERTAQGWTIRQSQGDDTLSEPLYPERAYLQIAGGRQDQNYRNGHALLVEPPGAAPLCVHTADEMALLSPAPSPSLAADFWREHQHDACPQAALDVASLGPRTRDEGTALLESVHTHLQPLVTSGQLPSRALHPILSGLAAALPEMAPASRVALFAPLVDAFTAPRYSGPSYQARQALDVLSSMVASAQPQGAELALGLPLERQLELATRVIPFVGERERQQALTLVLDELPRSHPDGVDAATRLIAARVPLARVVEGLAAVGPFDDEVGARVGLVDLLSASAAAQPGYPGIVDDFRAARDLPLGALPLEARAETVSRFVAALARRGDASEARGLYARLSASVAEGRLGVDDVAQTVDAIVSHLEKGASPQRALQLSNPAQAADAHLLLAAAVTPLASPDTAARIAHLPAQEARAFAASVVAQAATPAEALTLGTAALDALSRTAGCEQGARLAFDGLAEMGDASVEERVAALNDVLPLVNGTSADELVAVGDKLLAHVRFGSKVRHVILKALKDDAEVGPTIKTGLEALGPFPKNLVSYDRAAATIIENRHLAGGKALAEVGLSVFRDVYRGMNTGDGMRAAAAYCKALQGDPEVGTAMWLAHEVCRDESMATSDHLQVYIAEAAMSNPPATTGQELATVCLQALDRVPEGSPRSAVRLSQALLKALSRLYSDGPSREVIQRADRVITDALKVSMAFGGSTDGDVAARDVARKAIMELQATEDATTRLHRRMTEMETAAPIEQADDFVVVGGVRVPRRR